MNAAANLLFGIALGLMAGGAMLALTADEASGAVLLLLALGFAAAASVTRVRA